MSEDKKVEEGKETEIVDKKDTAVAPVSRVSGKNGRAAGSENIDIDKDIKMPRVAVLQGLSQLVSDGKATPGKLANSITKEIYGDELIFIPLFLFKTRARFKIGEGLICFSRDAISCQFCNCPESHMEGYDCLTCDQGVWPTKQQMLENPALSGPDCNLVYNYPVLNAKNLKQFPVSISLMRSASKSAKDLNSMLVYTGEDFFSSKIKMTVKKQENDKGTFFIPQFEMVGRCTDDEFLFAKNWYGKIRHKTIDINLEDEAPFVKDDGTEQF